MSLVMTVKSKIMKTKIRRVILKQQIPKKEQLTKVLIMVLMRIERMDLAVVLYFVTFLFSNKGIFVCPSVYYRAAGVSNFLHKMPCLLVEIRYFMKVQDAVS